MGSDPRTAGGSPPRETVTLTRPALRIPLEPVSRDEGHQGLSSPGEIARSPETAHRIRDDQVHGPAGSADSVEAVLRDLDGMWGAKAQENAAKFTRYMESLPEQQRQEVLRGNRSHDLASFVQEVVGRAERPRPELTIEGCEAFMRTNRAAWLKDDELQAIYRGLLDERSRGS